MAKALDQRYRRVRQTSAPDPVSTFSYYGGKSKIAGRYSAPRYPLIIEPFGGAAAYAWLHRHRRAVWINDLNPDTFAIWQFLQAPDAAAILRALPPTIPVGHPIAALAPPGAPPGLLALLRAELARGTAGRRDVPTRATAFGAIYYWPRLAARFCLVAEQIAGWRITNLDYRDLPDVEATWFIDPPYANNAGRRYRHAAIDYAALGAWVRGRRGHIIACENHGASWLPFEPLTNNRIGRQPKTSSIGEAVWESPAPLRLWK